MARFGFGQVAKREWLSDFFEHHRAHGDVTLTRAGGSWLEFAFLAGDRLAFVMSMCAAQEWNSIEDVLLEPFEPEINHWRNKQRDQLRKNQAANNHSPSGRREDAS